MAPPKRLLAFPVAFACYAIGWWGIAHGTGVAGTVLPFLWVFAYFGVFWLGWAGVPLFGLGATLLQPALPEPWRTRVRAVFVGWLVAWFGVLLALVWLRAPPGFERVPL